jgi:uncharacterized membrane protein
MTALKPLLGLGLLGIAIYLGFTGQPLWVVPVLAIVFTAGYIQGKWYVWKPLFQTINAKLFSSLLITYLTQTVVVLVFYLLGSGAGRVFGRL